MFIMVKDHGCKSCLFFRKYETYFSTEIVKEPGNCLLNKCRNSDFIKIIDADKKPKECPFFHDEQVEIEAEYRE